MSLCRHETHCFFKCYGDHRDLHVLTHSFPTRRASDLTGPGHGGPGIVANTYLEDTYSELYPEVSRDHAGMQKLFRQFSWPYGIPSRSEEHTSELQSLMRNSYAVFCLKKITS